MEKQNNSTAVVDEKIAQADRQTIRRGQLAGVLIKPVVTEKATAVNHLNQYVFMVANKANKIDIAKAVSMLMSEDSYWITGQTIQVDGGEGIINIFG